jgi:WD40 repeat protein
LVPLLETVEELEPITAEVGLDDLSESDPLAARPVPSPFKPSGQSGGGVPLLAWLAIGGGGLLVVVVLACVALIWGLSSKPVAQVPPAPPPPAPVIIHSSPAPAWPPPMPTIPTLPRPSTPSPATSAITATPTPKIDTPVAGIGTRTNPRDKGKIGDVRSGMGRSQEGFSGDESFAPRTTWNVTVDPPPEMEPAPDKLIDIDFKTKVDKLVFPARPSPYFAAATDDYRNAEIRIFDWRTGRSVRKFPGKLNYQDHLSAVSADGEHATTVMNKGGDTGIVIVETKTGKAVHTIVLEDRSNVKTLAFAGPNRFIAVVHSYSRDERNRVGVWNLEDGSVLSDFTLESPVSRRYGQPDVSEHGLAVSPGGKFFAILLDNFVCIFETETGTLAGELRLPTADSLHNATLTFSPDGQELVLIAGHQIDGTMLYRMDVATGDTIGSAKINAADFKDVHYYQTLGRLQFLPTLKCYLIDGAFVVEPTTGETLYRIDAFQGMARVFGEGRVAGITARARSSGFAEFKLPMTELEKLAAVFQGGGKLLDGLWGPAKVGAFDGARSLRLPASMTEWSLPAWEPPTRAKGKKVVSLPVPTDGNHSWTYDTPIFSPSASHIAWLPRNERMNSRLFAIDTATGKAQGDVDMLPGSRALDISPDGSLVIAAMGKRQHYGNESFERLEVFSIPQKKHVLAWRLGGAVENQASNNNGNGDPSMFKEAYFIGKTLVLTRMETGRLVLWKLPDATAQWRLDGDAHIVDFSPDRAYVQLHLPAQEKYSWLEVRTGEWKGDMRGGQRWNASGLAFSPDRARTASLVPGHGYARLEMREVQDPDSEAKKFDLPSVEGPLTWLTERHVMAMGSGVVFDSANGAPVFRVSAALQIRRSPDGTYWLSKNGKGEIELARTTFPSEKLLGKLKTARSEPIKPIVGPGARVAVQSGFDTDPATQQRIQQEFTRRGWILDPNGTFRINGSTSQQPGKTVDYENLLTRQRTSVNIPGATLIQISLTDVTGKVLWKTEYQSGGGGYAPSMVMLRPGESLQDKVAGSQGSGPRPEITSVPEMIFPDKPFEPLPSMVLNEKGEQF